MTLIRMAQLRSASPAFRRVHRTLARAFNVRQEYMKYVLIIFLLAWSKAAASDVEYTGSDIQDRKRGIIVKVTGDRRALIVSRVRVGITLLLPQSAHWKISGSPEPEWLFFAQSDDGEIVSIRELPDDAISDIAFLRGHLAGLEANRDKTKIVRGEVTEDGGVPVLKTEVDASAFSAASSSDEFHGLSQVNFYSTQKVKNRRCLFHLSVMRKTERMLSLDHQLYRMSASTAFRNLR